jgi:O-methyltransferase
MRTTPRDSIFKSAKVFARRYVPGAAALSDLRRLQREHAAVVAKSDRLEYDVEDQQGNISALVAQRLQDEREYSAARAQSDRLQYTVEEHQGSISALVAGRLHDEKTIERLLSQDAARVEQIENLAARLVAQREHDVRTIERLSALDQERVREIDRLMAVNGERVTTIETLLASTGGAKLAKRADELEYELEDAQAEIGRALAQHISDTEMISRLSVKETDRVDQIGRLMALDVSRVKQIEGLASRFLTADGMTIASRNTSFMEDAAFKAAWAKAEAGNRAGWPTGVPDVRWRAHIAVWAAQRGLQLEGDFVECGVHTGLFSLTICHTLNFASLPRRFFLFDTFNGIPTDHLVAPEADRAARANADVYGDVYDVAKANFAPFPNAELVQGVLPDSLALAKLDRIAYLSVDLNNAAAERGVILALWDKLVPGAIVLIDDYAWVSCEAQYEMWNAFARSKGLAIATLPTGQGLLIKP